MADFEQRSGIFATVCTSGYGSRPGRMKSSPRSDGCIALRRGKSAGCFMLYRLMMIVAVVVGGFVTTGAYAEPAPVTCTLLPGGEAASVMVTNPLGYTASCQASCKFSTAVYDDNPQIICAKPIPAGKEVEMCILKAAGNKLLKLVGAAADCRRP